MDTLYLINLKKIHNIFISYFLLSISIIFISSYSILFYSILFYSILLYYTMLYDTILYHIQDIYFTRTYSVPYVYVLELSHSCFILLYLVILAILGLPTKPFQEY